MATKKATATVKAAPKPSAKPKSPARTKTKAKDDVAATSAGVEQPAAPNKPTVAKAEAIDVGGAIQELAAEAIEIAMAETAGEQGRNKARFHRGALMLRLDATAKALGEKRAELLREMNAASLAMAERHAILNYEPISDQEATMTKRVVERFGNSGEYPLVGAISRLTGQPVVNDAGEPLTVNITDVALNKLYALADVDPMGIETAVSFAYRHTEQVVKKAKAAARTLNRPLLDVLTAVDAARVKAPHPVTGDTIDVQPEGKEAMAFIAALVGEPPAREVVSIKTSRSFYDGFFIPLKKLMTAVASHYKPELIAASADGTVSNVFVLEMTLAQYFNVYEDEGVSAALGALVRGDILSEKQAQDFLNSFAFDPANDEWRQIKDIGAAVEAMGEFDDDEPEPEDGDGDLDWLEDDDWGDDNG